MKSALLMFVLLGSIASAEPFCVAYMSGIGCPHCANADPYVLGEYLEMYPNLVVIDYEVFQERQNSQMVSLYNSRYESGLGVPVLVISQNESLAGDTPIINGLPSLVNGSSENYCPLPDSTVPFGNLDINSLPALPKLWHNGRVLYKTGNGYVNSSIKDLLLTDDISGTLAGLDYAEGGPVSIATAAGQVNFSDSAIFGNWVFAWNREQGNEYPYVFVVLIASAALIFLLLWKCGVLRR